MSEIRKINWLRSWPNTYTFSWLAFVLSLMSGVAALYHDYGHKWSPLERAYLGKYVASGMDLSPVPHPKQILILVNDSGAPAVQRDLDRGMHVSWSAKILTATTLHRWLQRNVYGGRGNEELLHPGVTAFIIALMLLVPLGMWLDIKRAVHRRDGIVLRGARLVSRRQYHWLTRKNDGVGWLTSDKPSFLERLILETGQERMVRIARYTEAHHILIMGDTGTRKSNLMLQAARQARARGESAIIFDPETEYLAELYDPATDTILNPFDARSHGWNPSDELVQEGESASMAKSVFPENNAIGQREDKFFVEAGREIFKHLLEKRPDVDKMLAWTSGSEINKLVRGTTVASHLPTDAPQQRAGVLGVVVRATKVYELLKRVHARPQWTAESWVNQGKGFIFITSTPTTRDALRPLITLLFDVLLNKLCARDRSTGRPVWLFMDEVQTLDTIPQLPMALTMGRKAKIKVVIGLQNVAQLQMNYGLQTRTIISQPATRIILRLSEPESAEMGSKAIGDQEAEEQRESRSHGRGEGSSASTEIRNRAAVMPSQIANLKDGHGVFKVPGLCLKVEFTYIKGKTKHQGFIPAEKPVPAPATVIPVVARPDWAARKMGLRQRI